MKKTSSALEHGRFVEPHEQVLSQCVIAAKVCHNNKILRFISSVKRVQCFFYENEKGLNNTFFFP